MIKRDEFAAKMLEYQLNLIGKSTQEAVESNKQWLYEWVLSEEQSKHFKEWFVKQALKTYKIPKKKVISNILNPFLLQWGLNVKKS